MVPKRKKSNSLVSPHLQPCARRGLLDRKILSSQILDCLLDSCFNYLHCRLTISISQLFLIPVKRLDLLQLPCHRAPTPGRYEPSNSSTVSRTLTTRVVTVGSFPRRAHKDGRALAPASALRLSLGFAPGLVPATSLLLLLHLLADADSYCPCCFCWSCSWRC